MAEIDREVLHKEIDLIQACITRMTNNSFLLKGWTISLLAVLVAVTGSIDHRLYAYMGMLAGAISFWYLDSFFLQTERMYRKMHEWVVAHRSEGNREYLYDLDPRRFKDDVESRLRMMFSSTLWVFYLIPLLIVVALIVYEVCGAWIAGEACGG